MIKNLSSIGNKSLLGDFFTKIVIIIILLFLAQIVVSSIQQQSLEPVIRGIGEKFFLSTQSLSIEANTLINNKGITFTKISDFSALFVVGKSLLSIFESFLIILFWLQIIYYIVGVLPFSTRDKVFRNVVLSILIFIFFQSLFILSVNSINKNVDCFAGCQKSITNYLVMPIKCFIDFSKSIPYLLKPIENLTNITLPNINLNQTIKII